MYTQTLLNRNIQPNTTAFKPGRPSDFPQTRSLDHPKMVGLERPLPRASPGERRGLKTAEGFRRLEEGAVYQLDPPAEQSCRRMSPPSARD